MTLLSGCATTLLASGGQGVTNTTTVSTLVMEDEIVATGHPKPDHENQVEINSVVLIGNKNTYHITKGTKEIDFLTKLDPHKIHINNDKPISLVISGNKFHGVIKVEYLGDGYSPDELNTLKSAYFMTHTRNKGWIGLTRETYYTKEFFLQGEIYEKLEINDSVSKLSKGRLIRFVTIRSESHVDPGKALDMLFALPFAVAFDVVTAPAQIIFLAKQRK
ncbi:MAG: hypothetical protein WA123_03240 [Methylotenera sp.]